MAEKKKKASGKSPATEANKTVKKSTAKKAPSKKAPAKQSEDKNSLIAKSKTKRPKRKTNLLRLCSEMNKVTLDAVDKEVTKRFRTLIDAAEEDITKTSLQSVLKNWKEADLSQFHESLQPYVKHYIFMVKRRSGR